MGNRLSPSVYAITGTAKNCRRLPTAPSPASKPAYAGRPRSSLYQHSLNTEPQSLQGEAGNSVKRPSEHLDVFSSY